DGRRRGPVVLRLSCGSAVHVLRRLFSAGVYDDAHLAGPASGRVPLRRHRRAAARRPALAPTPLLWPRDGRGPDPAALRWPCGALTASPYVVSAYVPAARSTKDSTERTRASRRGRCRTRATAQTARDGGIASSGRNKSVPDKLVVLELWA